MFYVTNFPICCYTINTITFIITTINIIITIIIITIIIIIMNFSITIIIIIIIIVTIIINLTIIIIITISISFIFNFFGIRSLCLTFVFEYICVLFNYLFFYYLSALDEYFVDEYFY